MNFKKIIISLVIILLVSSVILGINKVVKDFSSERGDIYKLTNNMNKLANRVKEKIKQKSNQNQRIIEAKDYLSRETS